MHSDRLRVALLCFMPDPGHIIPLLRIGALIKQCGGDVRFFGSAETLSIAEELGIVTESIGYVRPQAHQEILAQIASSSHAHRLIRLDKQLALKYLNPIVETAFSQIDSIKEKVAQFAPSIVLADDHMLRVGYKLIAERCNAPLILHHAYGSLYCPDQSMAPVHAGAIQKIKLQIIKTMAKIVGAGSARIEKIFSPSKFSENEKRIRYINGKWLELSQLEIVAKHKTLEISSGLAPLEKKYLKFKENEKANLIYYGSVPPTSSKPLDEELKGWLESSDSANVIYVCFGSMVSAITDANTKIVSAILQSKLRVLWAAPQCPWKEDEAPPPSLARWEKWTPQPTVLAHPSVKAFITHAGSGAIQETLWFAKPAICIPLHADQPYNANVAQQLGFGITLNKKRLSHAKILKALEFAQMPHTIETVTHLSEEMHSLAGGARITELIHKSEKSSPQIERELSTRDGHKI